MQADAIARLKRLEWLMAKHALQGGPVGRTTIQNWRVEIAEVIKELEQNTKGVRQ